ncbi:Ankyrin-3 [Colletotrichum siamense]|uniref:Ankyrin-3 n=1 Tax=Colletotrichum siamense TaxID=690259 RepID=A0A9P5ESY8_COLSI|nr:Ankyrin-3 [Colletotrichum siamense]KAF4859036.1 Ankyrin-3 [Colletotrichum siamense]
MPTDDVEQLGAHAKRAFADDSDDSTGRAHLKRQRTSTQNVKHGWWRKPGHIKLSHTDYTVGWICALPIELAASHAMLDAVHESLPAVDNDTNAYILGSIGDHNIAMACLPSGQYGTNNAAIVASNMTRSFRSIRFGFMVGIGGGVPGEIDIRLGDVIVGTSVIQHDLGKIVAGNEFQGTGTPRIPPQALLNTISKLRALHEGRDSKVAVFLHQMQERYPRLAEYAFPTSCQDQLFRVRSQHHHDDLGDCSNCGPVELCQRPSRNNNQPLIHYGGIASGNQVIKCGQRRDELAKERNVICFEMEAAGLSDGFPCIVIRGICDYADSQKNKQWQKYAAATAAAYAKELILTITPNESRDIAGGEDSEHSLGETLETIQARRAALLNSLRFEQIDARHATIKKAHSETCEWLLQNPLYKKWLDKAHSAQHHGFFWISGKPGAGKSTIMKFTFNRAKRAIRKNGAIISFFFNARGDTLEKSTFGLYRSLLLQLLERFPDLQTVLEDSTLIPSKQTSCPDIDILQDLFREALRSIGQRRVTCFIDALDECDETQIREMIVFFEQVGEQAIAKDVHLKICFSSRHYPHIDVRYGLKLILEDQPGHKHDLDTYIKSYLRAGSGPHIEKIRAEILEKAGGVFMWVVLVVDLLNKELVRGNWYSVKRLLREIPAGLSELFKDILRRDSDNTEQFLLCMQWVLFARRPLTPIELHYAVLSGLSEGPEHPIVHDSDWVGDNIIELFVTSSSKGLAEITKSDKATVQFIHESVRDFLFKDNGLQELWPTLGRDFETSSHETLKNCCLTHITDPVCDEVNLLDDAGLRKAKSAEVAKLQQLGLTKFPFLAYATENVFYHANLAAERLSQETFLEKLPLAKWISLNNMLEKYHIRRYTPAATLAYIFAERDFCNLLECHTRGRPAIQVYGERHRYPFFAALANGNLAAAKVLLGRSAESISIEEAFPNLERGLRRIQVIQHTTIKEELHPLHWAIKEEQWTVARLIVDSGEFNCATSTKSGHTCIHLAVMAGNEAFMRQMLEKVESFQNQEAGQSLPYLNAGITNHGLLGHRGLKNDAYIDKPDEDGRTPLWLACSYQNEGIINQLLERGADKSNIRFDSFRLHEPKKFSLSMAKFFLDNALFRRGTVLNQAISSGSQEIVTYVLGGDRISAVLGHASAESLVENAAGSNRTALLQLLLDNGAIDGYRRWNADGVIIPAYSRNDEDMVRYLLNYGAQARALLCEASYKGDEGLVNMITDNYLNKTDPGTQGQLNCALHDAVKGGRETIIQLLLAQGADPNARLFTPHLHQVSTSGHESLAEVLLGHGTEPNVCGNQGRSALHEASAAGREAMVRTLLRYGAHVNRPDNSGRTALYEASAIGQHAIVELLLEHGADVNRMDNFGGAALCEASKNGHSDVVKTLLSHGAHDDSISISGRTPLFEACVNGRTAVVEIFIRHGANVNLPNANGETALDLARLLGYTAIIKLLENESKAEVVFPFEEEQLVQGASCRNTDAQATAGLVSSGGGFLDLDHDSGTWADPFDFDEMWAHYEGYTESAE